MTCKSLAAALAGLGLIGAGLLSAPTPASVAVMAIAECSGSYC